MKKIKKIKHCEWKFDSDACAWDSQCGAKTQFTHDGPKENEYKFCPGCGRRIQVIDEN